MGEKYAYIDSDGGEHLPIGDEDHARNAIQRFAQTDFESDSKKREAAKKVLKAAEQHGIDVSDDSAVAKAAK